MTQKSITIKASLDARQAAYFVQTAGKFESEIQVSVDEKRINAKSIMGTIALNMQEGQTALITADGKDEAAAVEELAAKIGGNAKVIADEPYYRYIPKNGLKLSTKVSMTVSDQFKMVKMIHLKL